MNMMTGNALLTGAIRRNKIPPKHTGDADTDALQPFYRALGGVRPPPPDKRGTKTTPHNTGLMNALAPDEAENFHILLIAKEQRERQAICTSMSQHAERAIGYWEARNGETALQMIGSKKINLIIFRDGIEDMDSLEFMGRLNQKCSQYKIPVIAILHAGATKAGVQAMKLGAYAYLLMDSEKHHFELLPILVARLYTEQKKMISARKTIDLYKTIADSIPAVSYRISLQDDHHDVCISPQFAELGFSADQWGTDTELHHRMCHAEDRPAVIKALNFSYLTGAEFQCEYRINTKGNTVRWFHDKAMIIADKQGRPLFLQGVMTDITDIKNLGAELTSYRCMLDGMVQEKTTNLNRRLAILESCNSSLGENYHKMHQMYLDLLLKTQSNEEQISTSTNA